MSFSKLKRSSGRIDKLRDAASAAASGKKDYSDDRFWNIKRDKSGNAYAVIRFLPEKDPEKEEPWVETYSHGFQDPKTGLYYINECPTTIGRKCPVCEDNSRLYSTGHEEDKDLARRRKRRKAFISNIYVLEDPANPENEGKVFLYRYGTTIMAKINEALRPSFPDVEPMNPFDFWGGGDFKLKVRTVDKFPKYDMSDFSAPSELLGGDDEALEKVYNSMYDLHEFVDPENFKSYTELQHRFDKVTGEDRGIHIEDANDEEPPRREEPKEKRRAEPPMERERFAEPEHKGEEEEMSFEYGDDDTMEMFRSLANSED